MAESADPGGALPPALRAPDFLRQAGEVLRTDGFLTDAHDCVPRGESVAGHCGALAGALAAAGHPVTLEEVPIKHLSQGLLVCLYNTAIFPRRAEAYQAIHTWLDMRFEQS